MSDINVIVNDEIVNIDVIDEPVLVNVVNSPGVPGAPGQGVPVGGTTGQVLAKNSNTNYDTEWVDVSGGAWGTITGTLSNQTDLQSALNNKVPYTGATTNVNLGEYEIKAGQVTLDTSPTGTAAVGTTRWNDTIGSSETTLKGGSVILKNGVDLVARVVNKVSEDDAMKLGVDMDKAKGIFRVDDGKANLSPPADKSTYRQMIGVKIDNGEWIGVCVPFDLPDEWKGMTDAVVNEMLRMIELGPRTEDGSQEYYSIRPQDKDRFVGRVVTTFAFDDPKHMKNDGQAKRIIKTWHDKGLIEEFEYRSESQRKDRKGVRPVGRVGEQF